MSPVPEPAPEALLYLEDIEPGPVGTFGSYTPSEREIVEFGERYNPLEYHVATDRDDGPFGEPGFEGQAAAVRGAD